MVVGDDPFPLGFGNFSGAMFKLREDVYIYIYIYTYIYTFLYIYIYVYKYVIHDLYTLSTHETLTFVQKLHLHGFPRLALQLQDLKTSCLKAREKDLVDTTLVRQTVSVWQMTCSEARRQGINLKAKTRFEWTAT